MPISAPPKPFSSSKSKLPAAEISGRNGSDEPLNSASNSPDT
jgi:hypothetical protein